MPDGTPNTQRFTLELMTSTECCALTGLQGLWSSLCRDAICGHPGRVQTGGQSQAPLAGNPPTHTHTNLVLRGDSERWQASESCYRSASKCLVAKMESSNDSMQAPVVLHDTASGYNCALQAVESKLKAFGVRRLVVQSVRSLLPMWLGSLGFMPLTLAEADALDPLLVSPDPDSAQLIKKTLIPGLLLFPLCP